MSNSSNFAKALAGAKNQDYEPVMKLARENPQAAAVLSKLTTAPNTSRAATTNDNNSTLPDMAHMNTLSDRLATSVADAETVMEVMPDMMMAEEILIGAIIAPKDMMTCELTYRGGDNIVSSDVAANMLNEISEHFQKNYKIKDRLVDIVRDVFIRVGSYVYAVIPENSIDEIINSTGRITMESMKESVNSDGSLVNRGLLGNPYKDTPMMAEGTAFKLSLEGMDAYQPEKQYDPVVKFDRSEATALETYISVTDNADIMKMPSLAAKMRDQRIKNLVKSNVAMQRATGQTGYAAEAFGNITERETASQIFKNPAYAYKPMVRVHTQDQLNRRAIGNPLVLHLPSESVMPVFVPGKPEEHIGYFLLLDKEGNPVSKIDTEDQYRNLTNKFSTGDNFASTMIRKVKNQIDGNWNQFSRQHLDTATRVFGELIEQELVMRLNNGVYSGGVAMAKQEEIYRIMLARTLAKQHTQLLFLPVELTTYFAVKYNASGIGVSILEKMKTLSSLRMMTMFANVAASMKNSIGRTQVTVKFDEDDPDPQKSFETIVHEFMRTRQGVLPVGLNNPADITDWMSRAGYEFVPEGNPLLPDVKIDVQQKSDSYIKPDTDLEEKFRKQHITAMGVSPEQVDASFNAEFATVANNNNLLLSKRALQHQQQITPLLTDHHRKVIRNTESLLRVLAELIGNNLDKIKEEWLLDQQGNKIDFTNENGERQKSLIIAEVLEQFIRSLEVVLPAPNTASLTNQLAAMTEYAAILDAAIESHLVEQGLTSEIVGEVANLITGWKALVKAHYMRKYMADNGILPELAELTTKDENGKPILDLYQSEKDHTAAIMASLAGFVKSLVPQKEETNTALQDANAQGTDTSGSTDDGSTTDDNAGTDNAGGDGFDNLDLGGDNDNPLEAKPDNTAPVEGEDEADAKSKEGAAGDNDAGAAQAE